MMTLSQIPAQSINEITMPNRKRERAILRRNLYIKYSQDQDMVGQLCCQWQTDLKGNIITDCPIDMNGWFKLIEKLPPKQACIMSPEAMDKLKSIAPESDTVNILGIEVKSSQLFPFELPDGSICHGVVIPVDPPPEAYDSPRLNFFNDEPNFPWNKKVAAPEIKPIPLLLSDDEESLSRYTKACEKVLTENMGMKPSDI